MECSKFSTYLVCPHGSGCGEDHVVPHGRLLESIFNQNEMILMMLSKIGGRVIKLETHQASVLPTMINFIEEKKMEPKLTAKVKKSPIEDKIDQISKELSTLKTSLIEMGTPMLPPLSHISHSEDSTIYNYKPYVSTLRGKDSTSYGKQKATLSKQGGGGSDSSGDVSSPQRSKHPSGISSPIKETFENYIIPEELQKGMLADSDDSISFDKDEEALNINQLDDLTSENAGSQEKKTFHSSFQ